jgi:hypothetical protein
MRRLLTGYAVTYNRRHRRHGHLFQNRYKSVLCQEEPYFLELVRYIHLNPLRAKIVLNLDGLDSYPYAGHRVVLGRERASWQDVNTVLSQFGGRASIARRRYREFVREGIKEGRRPDLVRGGLKRGIGGWEETRDGKAEAERIKGDERILGEGEFIENVLRTSEEELERRYRLRTQGYDLERLIRRVGEVTGIEPNYTSRSLLAFSRDLPLVRSSLNTDVPVAISQASIAS